MCMSLLEDLAVENRISTKTIKEKNAWYRKARYLLGPGETTTLRQKSEWHTILFRILRERFLKR